MTLSPMEPSSGTIRVIILGGGKDGTAFLELLIRSPRVSVVGIADSNPNAPGLRLAQKLGIPTSTDALAFIAENPADLIADLTGDPTLGPLIIQNKPARAEVMGGTLALLIWEVAQYERDLRDQLTQAEKLATIGTVATGIAHEINNPLHVITGLAEHLREERRPEVIKEYADEIHQSARRIATIVREVNAFARKSPQESVSDIDINRTLDEAVTTARRSTIPDQLTVVTQYGAIPHIRGNSEELLQVFMKLVANAIQAMEGRGTLTLSTAHADGSIHATVRDTGPGIPRDIITKIFDPFFTTKDPGQGTGLGLHFVRDIVRFYGGQVMVESSPGQGAAFKVTLPVISQLTEDRPRNAEGFHWYPRP